MPAKLAARVRVLSTGHGRKNDNADATSVAVAAQSAAGLRTVTVDEAVTALRALVEHRDDVVKTRTQTVNRLHALLTQLLPAGAPRQLTANTATQLLRPVRPRSITARTLRRLAAELITEIRHLEPAHQRREHRDHPRCPGQPQHPDRAARNSHLNAGKILARVGDVHRFRSAATFASYTGTAPIEVSSGDVVRHRLSRAGDRQLNCCLHTMAITQLQRDCPGRTYYLRKRADGKSHKEALRCLKRRLSDVLLPVPDPRRRPAERGGPGRTPGGDYELQRGRLNPYHRPFGQVTSRTRHDRPYNLTQDPLDTERSRLG